MTKPNGFSFKDPVDIRVKDVDSAIVDAAYQVAVETREAWGKKTAPLKRKRAAAMRVTISNGRGRAKITLSVARSRMYRVSELLTSTTDDTTGAARIPVFYTRPDGSGGSTQVEALDTFVWDGVFLQRQSSGKTREARADFGPRDELSWYRDDLVANAEKRFDALFAELRGDK